MARKLIVKLISNETGELIAPPREIEAPLEVSADQVKLLLEQRAPFPFNMLLQLGAARIEVAEPRKR
jgi:hypothetical protein